MGPPAASYVPTVSGRNGEPPPGGSSQREASRCSGTAIRAVACGNVKFLDDLSVEVPEVSIRSVGIAADMEDAEQRAECCPLVGGVDSGPLAVAAVRVSRRQAAHLVPAAVSAQTGHENKRLPGSSASNAEPIGVRTQRIDDLHLNACEGLGPMIAVLMGCRNDGAKILAGFVNRPSHLVGLASDLHSVLILVPAADLPRMSVRG